MNWIKHNLEFLLVVAIPLGATLGAVVSASLGY